MLPFDGRYKSPRDAYSRPHHALKSTTFGVSFGRFLIFDYVQGLSNYLQMIATRDTMHYYSSTCLP